ncbi:DUF3558 domain-containing protein [Streptomyces sp. NPDC020298]|uniref:DUF3558 domain-containing protein n=1 Tax=unclassified Streptomyces TaxID=2593676 RepID=UPI0033C25426
MSEGTMQRAAQRDDQRAQRGQLLPRLLVGAAAVPVMLVAAGCSSDSGSDGGAKASQQTAAAGADAGSASASASPSVQAAAYAKLPEPCAVLSKSTLGEMVPKGAKSGKEGTSSDTSSRSSCSWSSLDNNGVKGSQFRWLNVSLLRFDSDANRGSGEKQAQVYYADQVKAAQSVSGAKNSKTEPVSGTGNEASVVHYDLKKKEGGFKQQTLVVRTENVVVTLDYNGAGLAGDKTPDASGLTKAAEKAAKEAVAAVSKANGQGAGGSSDSGSGAGSGGASSSPSKSASKSPSKSASPSASSSGSKKGSASASPSKSAASKG